MREKNPHIKHPSNIVNEHTNRSLSIEKPHGKQSYRRTRKTFSKKND
jgi:hypothetical protein